MTTLITHIKQLVNTLEQNQLLRGKQLGMLPSIENAFLLVEDGIIAAYGSMYELELKVPQLPAHIIDASGQFVLPCWCDSHTHIVFAGSRENEFVDKIKGLSYAEIAAKGGGILNSSEKLNAASEEQLFNESWQRLSEINKLGTAAVEIKSGYGLSVEGELKMLRVIKKLKERSGMMIKATFLAAHTYPKAYKEDHQGYIDLIIDKMLPVIAAENLADYIDVFCETGFFSPAEMETICKAGAGYGLKPKLHVNQLNSIGGIETAIKLNAISADHLETMTDRDISNLSNSNTIGTLLPTAAFFLRMARITRQQGLERMQVVALHDEVSGIHRAATEFWHRLQQAERHFLVVFDDGFFADPVERGHLEIAMANVVEIAGGHGSKLSMKKAAVLFICRRQLTLRLSLVRLRHQRGDATTPTSTRVTSPPPH